ncbi:MAG TPA: hypothetical protein DCL44_09975 [Elusimicrobia bacterium]|nr:hypothetical protein [Elusimicrobiota bacterium]
MLKTDGLALSLQQVDDGIGRLLRGIDPAIFDISRIPFNFLGKAARARFSILMGDALGIKRQLSERVGVTAELTHTASLLHDDCVDKASSRRGVPTLNTSLGVNKAILVGDLMVAIAFDRAAQIAPGTDKELVNAVRRMTEGALLEENSKGLNSGEEELYRITALKTGALFRWCALTLSRLAKKTALFEPCARLGEETGVCFQLVDDTLDFESETSNSGKDKFKDIFDGKRTLPLILALKDKVSGPELEKLMAAFAASGSRDLISAISAADIVVKRGFAKAAREKARERARTAIFPLIELLPEKDCAAELKNYINALIERTA